MAALFGQSARVEQNPGASVDRDSLVIAAYVLRRKEAWSRIASYLAFFLAAGLIVLVLVS